MPKAFAHWCSFVCIASTRDPASIRLGHEAPLFTSDVLRRCEHTGPLAMYTAFPCSDYYGSSAPLRRHRPATGLPRHDGRGRRSGSHVHPRTLQRGRWPAMPLQPRHGYAAVFHRGLPAGDITRPRSSTTGRPDRMCVATQPRSDRFELVVFGPTPSDSAGACRRCQGCFRRFFDSASARLAGSCPNPDESSVFPPDIVVKIKAFACELPRESGPPLSRNSNSEIASEAIRSASARDHSHQWLCRWRRWPRRQVRRARVPTCGARSSSATSSLITPTTSSM